MAKVTIEGLLPVHVRAGRALLDMSARQFSEFSDQFCPPGERRLSTHKVRNFENGRLTADKTKALMLAAIEGAGITLLNGGRPGARVTDATVFEMAIQSV